MAALGSVPAHGSVPAAALDASSTAIATDGFGPSPGPTSTATAPQQPAADGGSFGVRLLDVPVSEAGDPRAGAYIIDHLTPGTVVHRRIEISTTAHQPLKVAVYPDAAVVAGGSFVPQPEHTVNELTTWTSLDQDAVVVPARGATDATVTISVPKDAAPGERYGVVLAEVAQANPGTVSQVNRVGIRMYLSVGGNNPPAADFTVDTLTAHRDAQDHAFVEAMVHNTGGRAVDMSGALTLAATNGSLTAGPYKVTLGTTLAPGQSEPVRVVITDPVPDGPWNATIELRSGLLDKTSRALITFPHTTGVSAAATAHAVSLGGHLGLITGGLLTAMALGAIAFVFLRRDRRGSGM
ncbi:peptidase [Catenulispora yoronensis]